MSAPSDFELLQRVVASLQRHVTSAKINPHQCRLFQRRLRIIYDTLLRMPKREPTPILLSVFRAADYTVGRMGRGRWRHVLIQLFTCNALFECLRSRIRSVWSLQSTASWEKEDRDAMIADEVHNLEVIMNDASLVPAMLRGMNTPNDANGTEDTDKLKDALLHHYRRRYASQWKILGEDLHYTHTALLPDENGDVHPSMCAVELRGTSTQELFGKPPADVVEGMAGASCTAESRELGCAREVELSSPLFHNSSLLALSGGAEESEMHDRTAGGNSFSAAPAAQTSSAQFGALAARFFVSYEGLMYRGQHVVVKRLSDPIWICPMTLEAFVMDSAVRVRWSHPNLATVHGSFCEEFEEDGTPRLSLGMVLTDLCTPPEHFVPLQRLLFIEGRRFSLLEAIDVTLQVADALQFALFDKADVPPYVAERWCWISPSNVFLLDSSPWGGEPPPLTDTASIAVQDLHASQEDTGLTDATIVGRYSVKYSPPVFIEGRGAVSRWAPHPQAVGAETYALAQLFLALTTNMQPHHNIACQLQLQSMYQAARGSSSDASVSHTMPHGITVPRTLPVDVQRFCRSAMALASEVAAGHVTTPIRTLQAFRGGLHGLREHAATLPQLPTTDPTKTSFIVQAAVDDYGWILHRPFDAHVA